MVDLTYLDGSTKTDKAFALAWTATAVRIQWVEQSLARYAWIAPHQVNRPLMTSEACRGSHGTGHTA